MTCTAQFDNRMMNRTASASCANAAFCCAVAVILDAMILASIIIFSGIAILGVSLVLAAVLLCGKLNDVPWARRHRYRT